MQMNPVAKRALIGAAMVIIAAAVVMLVVSLMHRSHNHDDA